jgi:hypothetical protein
VTKGIFDVRTGSGYDDNNNDDIVERYHFPNR